MSRRLQLKRSYFAFNVTLQIGAENISETKQFPKALTIAGNLAVAGWLALGSIAVGLYNQLAGWIFLLFGLFTIFVILRRMGCKSCYYCKSCTMGFGRIAALFFGKRSLKDPKETYGMGTAIFCYALLGPLPAAFTILSLLSAFDAIKVAVLALLLAVLAYSLTTWRRQ